jgi:hypothetical protein
LITVIGSGTITLGTARSEMPIGKSADWKEY